VKISIRSRLSRRIVPSTVLLTGPHVDLVVDEHGIGDERRVGP